MTTGHSTHQPAVHFSADHNNHNHHQHHRQTSSDTEHLGKHEEEHASGLEHQKMVLKASTTFPFLLDGWSLQTVEGLVAALVVSTVLSVLRDALAYSLYTEEHLLKRRRQVICGRLSRHFRQTCMHMLSTALAYTLMLSVMTYNAWLLVAVLLGAGLSYFFLRPFIEKVYIKASLDEASHHDKDAFSLVSISAPAGEIRHNSQSEAKGKDDGFQIPERSSKNNTKIEASLLIGHQ